MKHDHEFVGHPAGTLMIDHFEFQSTLGILESIVDRVFLAGYMRDFLVRRNLVLKTLAESGAWSRYLFPKGVAEREAPAN
jgi:ligand-binding SRPBCC domain-containing protein